MVKEVGLLLAMVSGLLVASSDESKVSIRDIVGGDGSTCVLFSDGRVKCWGYGNGGENGRDDGKKEIIGNTRGSMGKNLPFVSLGTNVFATSICKQYTHTCVSLSDGKVKCWGQNEAGQLGAPARGTNIGAVTGQMGDKLQAVALPLKAHKVSCERWGGCAVLDDGSVYCWGSDAKQPDVPQMGWGGYMPMEGAPTFDEAFPPRSRNTISLGDNGAVKDIASGDTHTCALLKDGRVKCWGLNDKGQLGLGHTEGRFSDTPEDKFGNSLSAVNFGGRKAVQIAAAAFHNCVLLDNGSIRCWGQNESGQLGVGDTAQRPGTNLQEVELGEGLKAESVNCSREFCCAIVEGLNQVKCWGSKIRGPGDANRIGDQPGEMGDKNDFLDLGRFAVVKKMGHGYQHSCAALEDGRLFCWGRNQYGELGTEKTFTTSSMLLGDFLDETVVR